MDGEEKWERDGVIDIRLDPYKSRGREGKAYNQEKKKQRATTLQGWVFIIAGVVHLALTIQGNGVVWITRMLIPDSPYWNRTSSGS